MFDLLAEEFKDRLVGDINQSGLPLTAVAYILQEVLHQVSVLAQQQIAQQKQQRDAEESADKEP